MADSLQQSQNSLCVSWASWFLLEVSDGEGLSRRTGPRGAELHVSARKLWLHSDWLERHLGQQPSAPAVLVDGIIRQPFAELAFWQRHERPQTVECMKGQLR